ncbi:isoprenylcysteine carboxylmethyltransferase family protein [bacterium]|nr:MAG: isoprenylcysteine carboxylmethyltransferase family protein [bacterium]
MKKGSLYVILQFILLAILALSSNQTPRILSFILAGGAILLGLTAMLAMTKPTLTVMPEIARGAELSTTGPYKYIRHPIYTALMILGLAMLLQNATTIRILVYISLVIILILKANYEERLLAKHYRQYTPYKKTTKRFIPGIY